MLFQGMDASDACRRVGYLSPSQFSREYARFFGSAPIRDIDRLREEGFGPRAGERADTPGPRVPRKASRERPGGGGD